LRRNEKGLVAKIKVGDNKAFEELVQTYQKRIYMIAYGILKNEADAYDATQDVFLKVFKYINNFQENSSLYTWIYKITKNVSIDIYRKKRNLSSIEYGEQYKNESIYSESVHQKIVSPVEKVEVKELAVKVAAAMEKLSDDHRLMLQLREFDDLSYTDIAEILDISKGTVMSRLHHARINLKKYLKEYE
jgi:RNA polymerase sigma-70 factor (ECF subfamily)